VAQKFHFAILRIVVTHASRGLSVIAELLVVKWDINPTQELLDPRVEDGRQRAAGIWQFNLWMWNVFFLSLLLFVAPNVQCM